MEMECVEAETWLEQSIRRGKQFLIGLAANLSYLAIGMDLAWPNIFASDLAAKKRSIFGTEIECSEVQLDLVGSVYFMGSLPGFLLGGWLVRAVGRRRSMMAAAIPGLVGALLVALAVNIEMVLAGRFFEGFFFAMQTIALRSYVVEIADVEIRGLMSSLVCIILQLGCIVALAAGVSLAWYKLAFVSLGIITCHCFLVVSYLPESPTFLIVTQRDKEAKHLLRRLRGPAVDVPKMLQDIRDQNEAVATSLDWKVLLQKEILKYELLIFGLYAFSHFTGCSVLKANAVRILQSTDFALNKKISAILVPIMSLMGTFLLSFMLDRFSQSRCLLISFSIMLVAYSVLGTYSHLNDKIESRNTASDELDLVLLEHSNSSVVYQGEATTTGSTWNWIPLACLVLAALGQSIGAGPMPWILAAEYFPTRIRSQAMCICSIMGSLLSFAGLQLFSPMRSFLTEAGLYWSYGATALIGIPFTLLFVKNTTGMSIG